MRAREQPLARLRMLHKGGELDASAELVRRLLRDADGDGIKVWQAVCVGSEMAAGEEAEAVCLSVIRARRDGQWSRDGCRRLRLIAMRVRADIDAKRMVIAGERVKAMVSEGEGPHFARCMMGGKAPGRVRLNIGRGGNGLMLTRDVPLRQPWTAQGPDGLAYGVNARWAALPVRVRLDWGHGPAGRYLMALLCEVEASADVSPEDREALWRRPMSLHTGESIGGIQVGGGVGVVLGGEALERYGPEAFRLLMARRGRVLGGRRVALMARMATEWERMGRLRVSKVREMANEAEGFVGMGWQRETLWDVLTGVR